MVYFLPSMGFVPSIVHPSKLAVKGEFGGICALIPRGTNSPLLWDFVYSIQGYRLRRNKPTLSPTLWCLSGGVVRIGHGCPLWCLSGASLVPPWSSLVPLSRSCFYGLAASRPPLRGLSVFFLVFVCFPSVFVFLSLSYGWIVFSDGWFMVVLVVVDAQA